MTATLAARSPRLLRNTDVAHGLWIAAALTAASYLLGLTLGWANHVDPLEGFAVFTSYVCTYLCVKQRRIQYLVGATSTIAYCLLFWQQGLIASAALNLYLTPMLVYGWFRWRADADTRPVTRLAVRWAAAYGLVTVAAVGGAFLLVGALGGSFPLADSVILVGTVLAQLLLDNKKLETWVVWILVNVVATWVYFSAGLAIAGIQYVLFLANAVWGFVAWRRTMPEAAS